MTLTELLDDHAETLVAEAAERLRRAHLATYERAGTTAARERLETLLTLTREAIERRDTGAMLAHGERVGQERYTSGYDLSEVLRAFNILEETLWHYIAEELPPAEHAPAIGLVSTVLGAGKEALAGTYVSLAAQSRAPALNFEALFKGT